MICKMCGSFFNTDFEKCPYCGFRNEKLTLKPKFEKQEHPIQKLSVEEIDKEVEVVYDDIYHQDEVKEFSIENKEPMDDKSKEEQQEVEVMESTPIEEIEEEEIENPQIEELEIEEKENTSTEKIEEAEEISEVEDDSIKENGEIEVEVEVEMEATPIQEDILEDEIAIPVEEVKEELEEKNAVEKSVSEENISLIKEETDMEAEQEQMVRDIYNHYSNTKAYGNYKIIGTIIILLILILGLIYIFK